MTNSIEQEGSAAFWVVEPKDDWDSQFDTPVLKITVQKRSAKELQVDVTGPFGQEFKFRCPVPKLKPLPAPDQRMGAHVAVTWKFPSVILYVNGKKQQTRQAHAH
jgi:hypothetical protein